MYNFPPASLSTLRQRDTSTPCHSESTADVRRLRDAFISVVRGGSEFRVQSLFELTNSKPTKLAL